MEKEYYIPAGLDVKVKLNQHVEAGDTLSEGVINPSDVVKLKGIGEGRAYFVKAMKNAFEDAGMGGVNRRNFELIAKNAIDHVTITHPDGLGDFLPGSTVHYQAIERNYTPRADAVKARVDQAYDMYLEQPVLHYTIGTRVTKSMIENLKKHGIESVMVHKHDPGFTPTMHRLLDVPMYEDDFMHQLYSTNLEKRLVTAVNTGMQSSVKGPSPIAGLAYGVGFGQDRAPVKKAANDYAALMDMVEDEEPDEDKLSFE